VVSIEGRVALRACELVFVLLLAASSVGGCGGEAPRLAGGEPTPGFELSRLDGGSVSFPADLEGRIVAIRFWADWCPFCESEMRSIEPLYRAYKERGLRVLAVNVRQGRETAAAFIEPLGISYEVLLDVDGAVARAYGVSALPTTFLLDGRGRLAARILGESTPDVFERLVKGLVSGHGD
jgi:peroxiredoxin